jgi:hypothetical protein
MVFTNKVMYCIGKRSVGCPQARWSDDLRRTAGGSWMRVAEDRATWRAIGEAYVQQCGGLMMMMDKLKCHDYDNDKSKFIVIDENNKNSKH